MIAVGDITAAFIPAVFMLSGFLTQKRGLRGFSFAMATFTGGLFLAYVARL